MKKVMPNGKKIKEAREHLPQGSLQKEMAFAVGISTRQLRLIENRSHLVTIAVLERIAAYLRLPMEEIAYAINTPRLVPTEFMASAEVARRSWRDEDRLMPRHEEEYAKATMDEEQLFKEAYDSHDLKAHIDAKLNDETSAYVRELIETLSSLTWSERGVWNDVAAAEDRAICRRIRQLLVLLKGNDVWVYQNQHGRRLPERDTLPLEGERATYETRLVVGFGPPGEYGEVMRKVPVDNGQPYVLPAWDKFMKQFE